jgi:hypothetical protein
MREVSYLLSGWLQTRYPGVDWFSHDAGHLLEMMLGWKTGPHFGPFHILSYIFIGGGFSRGRIASVASNDATERRPHMTQSGHSRIPQMPIKR